MNYKNTIIHLVVSKNTIT